MRIKIDRLVGDGDGDGDDDDDGDGVADGITTELLVIVLVVRVDDRLVGYLYGVDTNILIELLVLALALVVKMMAVEVVVKVMALEVAVAAFPALFIFSSSDIAITDKLAKEVVEVVPDITALKTPNVTMLELMVVSTSSEQLVCCCCPGRCSITALDCPCDISKEFMS